MLIAFPILGYIGLIGCTLLLLKKRARPLTKILPEKTSKRITFCGLLAALTAILHAAPVFLPLAGMALSPLSSLPVLVGALFFADKALPMFLAAAALLLLISVEEAMIFLLATGPLGLAAALATVPNIPFWLRALVPTTLLTCGIFILTFIIGLPGLKDIVGSLDVVAVLALIIFSFVYSLLFMGAALFLRKRILTLGAKGGAESSLSDAD